jgi:hypothetical protein
VASELPPAALGTLPSAMASKSGCGGGGGGCLSGAPPSPPLSDRVGGWCSASAASNDEESCAASSCARDIGRAGPLLAHAGGRAGGHRAVHAMLLPGDTHPTPPAGGSGGGSAAQGGTQRRDTAAHIASHTSVRRSISRFMRSTTCVSSASAPRESERATPVAAAKAEAPICAAGHHHHHHHHWHHTPPQGASSRPAVVMGAGT